jgi:membrane fusion protein (multidrug efflux system)
VAARHLDPGAVVNPGVPIVELVHTDPAVVRFQLGERQVGLVGPLMAEGGGLEVGLTVAAYGGRRWTGRLVRLAPALRTESRAAAAEAEIANPSGELMPGMFGRLELDLGGSDDALLLPLAAVLDDGREGTLSKVFAVRDGKAHQVELRLGMEREGRGEVLEGLSPGDLVVVEGQQRLRDGQDVRIMAVEDRPDEGATTR